MKIAYVDVMLDGHHMSYMNALVEKNRNCILILPKKNKNFLDINQYILDSEMLHKHPIKYLKWIYEIKRIIKQEKVDVVHFLYGDTFYRYFGFGLNMFDRERLIITFHHVRRSRIRDFSLKMIFKHIKIGVVHTESIIKDIKDMGINNVKHIEYPQFNKFLEMNTIEAKRELKIESNYPLISVIGGTREDKGLDILLDALNYVNEPFHLLVAGQAITFDEKYINEKIKNYKKDTTIILKYLSDNELNTCLNASDIIVLPYRKCFDGASGPLAEGVWLRKVIIGPNHKSLGKIIEKNSLGITFESENIKDLARAINKTLKESIKWSEKAESYREKLEVKYFIDSYKNIYDLL